MLGTLLIGAVLALIPAAVAVTNRFNTIFGSPKVQTTSAGWIGSKAGKKLDIVTIDSNGYIDQAISAGSNVGTGTKVCILNVNIAAAVAAASDEAKAATVLIPNEKTLIELQCVDSSGNAKATTAAMVGDVYEIKRLSNGNYAVDTDTATYPKVIVDSLNTRYALGTVGGTLNCRFIDAQVAL